MPLADQNIIQDPKRLEMLRAFALLDKGADPAFDRLTRLASRISKAPVSLISLVDANREVFKSFVGLPEPWATMRETPLTHSFCQHVVATQSPLVIEDARQHPLVHDNLAITDLNVIAYIGIPLITSQGIPLGSFCVIDHVPRAWTQEELEILRELSYSVLTEIELSIELQERQRYEEELLTIRRADTELTETLDLDNVLTVAMDITLRATGADDGFIGLIEGEQLRAVRAFGGYRTGALFDAHHDIIGRVMRTRVGEIVEDVSADPDYIPYISHTRAKMVLPLVFRDRLIGAINLETRRPERFTQKAFEFLSLLVGRITIAIDNAQLYQISQEQLASMRELYDRVADLEQLKTDMIRIAVHDLRNPLGIVLGYSELLLEMGDGLDDMQREFISAIHKGGEKMKKIIGDILSLERFDSDPTDAKPEQFDLAKLVSAAFEENRAAAEAKRLNYRLDVPDQPVFVGGYTAHMREAIENLINNAIKYTPEEGAVSLRVWREGGKAGFEVKDSGIGVPEDQQANLFRPFFRAQTELTRKIDGTGLGLHLVKKIVERHGGQMHFSSVFQQGSTFGFTLPLAKQST